MPFVNPVRSMSNELELSAYGDVFLKHSFSCHAEYFKVHICPYCFIKAYCKLPCGRVGEYEGVDSVIATVISHSRCRLCYRYTGRFCTSVRIGNRYRIGACRKSRCCLRGLNRNGIPGVAVWCCASAYIGRCRAIAAARCRYIRFRNGYRYPLMAL